MTRCGNPHEGLRFVVVCLHSSKTYWCFRHPNVDRGPTSTEPQNVFLVSVQSGFWIAGAFQKDLAPVRIGMDVGLSLPTRILYNNTSSWRCWQQQCFHRSIRPNHTSGLIDRTNISKYELLVIKKVEITKESNHFFFVTLFLNYRKTFIVQGNWRIGTPSLRGRSAFNNHNN